jgi:hypothetical protein
VRAPLAAPLGILAVATGLVTIGSGHVFALDAVVDVVVDLSDAGRKVAPPTPKHPTYFIPVLGGYQERGRITANMPPPPPPNRVALIVARELAKQGYLVTNAKHPPTQVLSIFWGYLNPQISEPLPDHPESKVFFNSREESSMVAGLTVKNLDLNMEKYPVIQAMEEDRFFIMILAYDYKTYARTHRKLALWQAKMSVRSNGTTLDAVLPVLAEAGGPQFGRETKRPVMTTIELPQGSVEEGEPKVVRYPQPAH